MVVATPDKAAYLERASAPPFRTPPVISRNDRDVFRYLWRKSIPIVVDCTPLKGDWSPSRFCATHGAENVQIIDSAKAGTLRTTLSQFLGNFILAGSEGKSTKLKVCTKCLIKLRN